MNPPSKLDTGPTHNVRPYNRTPPDVEDAEDYRQDGYHPVSLGDKLGGKYRMLRKLGHGGYATVWLARDDITNKFVALKILKAEHLIPGGLRETAVLEEISKAFPEHPGHKHVLEPLDIFTEVGPNGEHECIVFEVMQGEVGFICRQVPPTVDKAFVLSSSEWIITPT